MSATQKTSTEFLTPDEVAAKLGVTRHTIYALIKRQKLPAIVVGSHFRISKMDFELFLIESSTGKKGV